MNAHSRFHHAGRRALPRVARLLFCPLAAVGGISHAADSPPHQDLIAYVAGTSREASVWLCDPGQRSAGESLGPCSPSTLPAWSADGSTLAYARPTEDGSGTVIAWHAWTADAAEQSGTCGGTFRHSRNPAVSPDGRYLAYEGYDDTPQGSALVVYDRQGGSESIWAGARRALFQPVWLPNPKLLLSLDPVRKIEIPGVDIDAVRAESGLTSGEALEGGPTLAVFVIGLDLHDSGITTELLLATRTQTVPALALVPEGPDSTRYSEWNPRVSPGGTRLVFESDYGGDREIFQLDQNGLIDLSNHFAPDWNPVWAANGRWIAFESFRDGQRHVYRMMADTTRIIPLEPQEGREYWSPSWSPDGESIVCVAGDSKSTSLAIHDIEDASWTPLPTASGLACWSPAWRPEP